MKVYFIIFLLITLFSCKTKEDSKIIHNSSLNFIWKMESCPPENRYGFTMYFFLNNDTVLVITDMTMLKFNYLKKNDSIIIGDKRFLIKKLANDDIQLFENGKLNSTVKDQSMHSLFWDAYNFNFYSYTKNVKPLLLEDEILMDTTIFNH